MLHPKSSLLPSCKLLTCLLGMPHIPVHSRVSKVNRRFEYKDLALASASTMPKLLHQKQISALEAATRVNRLVKPTSVTDILPSCSFADAWVNCGRGTCLCWLGLWHWAALHRQGWQGWLERPEGPNSQEAHWKKHRFTNPNNPSMWEQHANGQPHCIVDKYWQLTHLRSA